MNYRIDHDLHIHSQLSSCSADAEQNPEMTKKFGVMQAPTLVVVDGGRVEKYVNASNIKKYADSIVCELV